MQHVRVHAVLRRIKNASLQCLANDPFRLPKKLQTWDFLPLPMHSLKPYDVILNKLYYWCTRAKYCPCSRGQHAQVHQAKPVNKDLGLVIKNPNNNSNA